jgi:hypothetical protein
VNDDLCWQKNLNGRVVSVELLPYQSLRKVASYNAAYAEVVKASIEADLQRIEIGILYGREAVASWDFAESLNQVN